MSNKISIQMLIYEITAVVQDEFVREFEKFMRERHIPDLLETQCFESAEMARISEGKYRIRYLAKNRKTLEKYFETAAENLREDFIKNFPEGVEISREILEVLQSWNRS